jgi:hypothetical protein
MPLTFDVAKKNFQNWITGVTLTSDVDGALAVMFAPRTNLQFQVVTDVMFNLSGRDILFGYAVNPSVKDAYAGMKALRFFWRSNSEGIWRAGTGFEDTGRLIKGQDEDSGYVFETQIALPLQNRLSELATALTACRYDFDPTPETQNPFRTEFATTPPTLPPLIEVKSDESIVIEPEATVESKEPKPPPRHFFLGLPIDYYNYLVRALKPDGATQREAGIVDDYCAVVTYQETGLLAATDCGGLVLPYQDRSIPLLECGSTLYQGNTVMAKVLKDDYRLWDIILPCLQDPVGEPVMIRHRLFACQVIAETFRLRNGTNGFVFIELAWLLGTFRVKWLKQRGTGSPELQERDTCCAWVNSVHLSDQVSSYGNYTVYPRDFSFLPQKPIDYETQVDPVLLRKAKLSSYEVSDGKEIKTVTEAEYEGDFLAIEGATRSLADSGWVMGYQHLFVFNEKYNWLVREYKRRLAGFFSVVYDQGFKSGVEKLFALRFAAGITDACQRYRAQPSLNPNSVGSKRAKYLADKVAANPRSLAHLDQAFVGVIVRNEGVSGGLQIVVTSTTAGSLLDFLLKGLLGCPTIPNPQQPILRAIARNSPLMTLCLEMREDDWEAASLNDDERKAALKLLTDWKPS